MTFKMEDGVDVENNRILKMGATGNPNAERIAQLQEKKKKIEETLTKRNQELRQLCMQEADITGIVPPEMPLEPGESAPSIRRRVGTSYQLPENLLKNINNVDETSLEVRVKLLAQWAEAALGLANEHNISKTVRRKHMSEYQQHKRDYNALQEKLLILKEQKQQKQHQQHTTLALEQQHKQKKKPRPPEQDDTISVATTVIDEFTKSDMRQSLRSMRHTLTGDVAIDQRLSNTHRLVNRKSHQPCSDSSSTRETQLATGLFRLSFDDYSNYMERQENMNNVHQFGHSYQQIPSNQYHSSHNHNSHYLQQAHSPHMSQHSTHMPQHSPHMSQHSPHMSQHSPLLSQHGSHIQQHNQLTQQHSPRLVQQGVHVQQNSPLLHQKPPHLNIQNFHYNQTDYSKYNSISSNSHTPNVQMHRQSSPSSNTNPQKVMYYPSHTIHGQSSYNRQSNFRTLNPHQLQPHQQYEHNVMSSGLGGRWKPSGTGEMVWCTNTNSEMNWQRDKRFGSLDRRKNKRLHKRISPSTDSKSATLASIPIHSELNVRTASVKSSQAISRRSQDSRQLVRTQSLGSVGAQTFDSVCPSDDNSSCESDNHSIYDSNTGLRKPKQKEWLETSLDGPVSPTHSIISRSQSAVPSILAPEEKYIVPTPSIPIPLSNVISTHSPPLPQFLPQQQHIPQSSQLLQQSTHHHLMQPLSPIQQHSLHQQHLLQQQQQHGLTQQSQNFSQQQQSALSQHHHNIPQQSLPPPYIPPQSPLSLSSPVTPKPLLEIPAESNPSPRILENNIEIFNNNNIPKNGTIVQEGQCKPYHEETKPFEMSDYYKYSTKFKKSPVKQDNDTIRKMNQNSVPHGSNAHRKLSDTFEHQAQQNNARPFSPQNSNASLVGAPGSLNASLDLTQVSNVAENFSAEMNAWYRNHEHHIDNNNAASSSSKSRSTATLV